MSILGTKLKEIREKKGITLEVIYHRSKISLENLKMIESNQFEKTPDTYLIAFLKSYAKEIGLSENLVREAFKVKDNDELIEILFGGDEEQYREKVKQFVPKTEKSAVSNKSFSLLDDQVSEKKNFISETIESYFHRYKYYALTGFILLISAYGIYLLASGNGEKKSNVTAMSFDQVVDSVVSSSEIKPIVKTEVQKTAPEKPKVINRLFIKAVKESCYVMLSFPDTTGATKVVDFILPPDKGLVRKAESFEVTIGRAESAELYLNDQKLTLPKTIGVITKWKVDESLLKK